MASFLGIDLSKETFHACLVSDHAEAKKAFPNSPKGFEQLMAWLKNRHAVDVHICMEATGAYWEALASYNFMVLLEQRVSVVNPGSHQGVLAQSELLRTKTDAVDAALIWRASCRSQVPDALGASTAGNPCAASSDAALRASQDHAGAAVGLRSILERRRRCGLNLGSPRHARRTDRAG